MGQVFFCSPLVIPAKAGIQNRFVGITGLRWIPAFAGMTNRYYVNLNR